MFLTTCRKEAEAVVSSTCISAAPQPVSVSVLVAWGCQLWDCLCRALPDIEQVLAPEVCRLFSGGLKCAKVGVPWRWSVSACLAWGDSFVKHMFKQVLKRLSHLSHSSPPSHLTTPRLRAAGPRAGERTKTAALEDFPGGCHVLVQATLLHRIERER